MLLQKTLIRDATFADLPLIVDIYNAAIPSRRVTGDTEPVTIESRYGWFTAHSPEDYPIWVAQRQGQVAGWFSFQPFYGRPAYRKTAEISIYVSPRHRRRGVGTALLEQAIAQSPAFGFTTLLGFVFAQNQPSLQLLAQFDFAQWGFLPSIAEIDDSPRDLVILGRKL
ncbi:MAG: N-acetyltransferase family protein [Cyanobacteria bacterium P01_A01_bin.135]